MGCCSGIVVELHNRTEVGVEDCRNCSVVVGMLLHIPAEMELHSSSDLPFVEQMLFAACFAVSS